MPVRDRAKSDVSEADSPVKRSNSKRASEKKRASTKEEIP